MLNPEDTIPNVQAEAHDTVDHRLDHLFKSVDAVAQDSGIGRSATDAAAPTIQAPGRPIDHLRAGLGRMHREGRIRALPGADYRDHGSDLTEAEIERLHLHDSEPAPTEATIVDPAVDKRTASSCRSLAEIVAGTLDQKVTAQDKKVTVRSRKSSRRDQETLRFLRRSTSETAQPEDPASVVMGETIIPDPDETPIAIPSVFSSPAPWRDLTDKLKVIILQRALSQTNKPYAFTLDLGHDLWDQALTDPKGPTDFIRRRVSRHLHRALGRPTDFWFVVERAIQGRPHLHGAMAVYPQQLPGTREALRAAAGDVTDAFKRRVLRMSPITDGDGWALYSTKALGRSQLEFPGCPVACTRPLKARARELYERRRALILASLSH